MKNTISLKLNGDFRRLYSKGKKAAGAYVAVYMSRNRLGINRLGLTASTSLGHAVVRNRVKRLMRAAYTNVEERIGCGYDFVLVGRTRAIKAHEEQVEKDLRYSLHKLGLLEGDKKEE